MEEKNRKAVKEVSEIHTRKVLAACKGHHRKRSHPKELEQFFGSWKKSVTLSLGLQLGGSVVLRVGLDNIGGDIFW